MSKFKKGHAESVDKNQLEIVNGLKDCGLYVETGHDDILVETRFGKLLRFEIKNKPVWNKNGTLRVGTIEDSQYRILWQGGENYYVIENLNQALYLCGEGVHCDYEIEDTMLNPLLFRLHYKKWLSNKELNRLRLAKIINDGVKVRELLR